MDRLIHVKNCMDCPNLKHLKPRNFTDVEYVCGAADSKVIPIVVEMVPVAPYMANTIKEIPEWCPLDKDEPIYKKIYFVTILILLVAVLISMALSFFDFESYLKLMMWSLISAGILVAIGLYIWNPEE